jgi:hypothetical protein
METPAEGGELKKSQGEPDFNEAEPRSQRKSSTKNNFVRGVRNFLQARAKFVNGGWSRDSK